ncbi:hypothetical protein LAZ67_14000406 [Cordylochernes scorpioides]|uniref:F-box domain-containing protein n=1 Tax=Cordylochernes scorpioides TaxID=51811 RepID=A0ABY6L852_9ARAC|nr:hypothetical protein LAZ67_14000406 [Cordylochernes scorpioides]
MGESSVVECGSWQQHHTVSLLAEPHQDCPSNCQDPFTWKLPPSLALHVFSFLDPVSLGRCTAVCKAWRMLASDPRLWRRLCLRPDWQLASPAARHRQMISCRTDDGLMDWKKAFADRYRLHRNWLRGNCNVRTFHGHTQGVFCVQFDDTRIVSGSSDKTIKVRRRHYAAAQVLPVSVQVWNIRTNSPWSVMTLVGHSGTVRCLHLQGNRLVSGSSDCTIKAMLSMQFDFALINVPEPHLVWDLSTQHTWSSIACKVTMVGHSHTVRCLQVDEDKVVSGSYDHTLKVWDLRTGLCRETLVGHEGAVLCLQFDTTKIVSGSGDKTIKVWKEGRCAVTLNGHEDAVTCLQFDSCRIISGSLDRTIKFWSQETGACLSTLDWMKSEGHTGVIRCLQADGWRIVSGGDDKTLKVTLDPGSTFYWQHCGQEPTEMKVYHIINTW